MSENFRCSLKDSDEYRDFRSKYSKQKIVLDNDSRRVWTFFDTGPKTVLSPIIFLPCVSGTADIFYLQLIELNKKGYRAISLQYPTYWSHKEFIVGFLNFIDYYKFENIHLFGASLGGFLSQMFASEINKYVVSLILCNSFSDTSIFYRTETAPIFWLLPTSILRRQIMGKKVLDNREDKAIQDSNNFMESCLASLTQKELASRLTLNCTNSYIKSEPQLQSLPVTIIDVFDKNALSDEAREELYKMYPNGRRAHLKDGGSFPFISRFEEVNLHILLHLRQFDDTAVSAKRKTN